jgi:hypothetical protein
VSTIHDALKKLQADREVPRRSVSGLRDSLTRVDLMRAGGHGSRRWLGPAIGATAAVPVLVIAGVWTGLISFGGGAAGTPTSDTPDLGAALPPVAATTSGTAVRAPRAELPANLRSRRAMPALAQPAEPAELDLAGLPQPPSRPLTVPAYVPEAAGNDPEPSRPELFYTAPPAAAPLAQRSPRPSFGAAGSTAPAYTPRPSARQAAAAAPPVAPAAPRPPVASTARTAAAPRATRRPAEPPRPRARQAEEAERRAAASAETLPARRRESAGAEDVSSRTVEEVPPGTVSLSNKPAPDADWDDFPKIRIETIKWSPRADRRRINVVLDGRRQSELGEGDIIAGVLIERIDVDGVELRVGDRSRRLTVGR